MIITRNDLDFTMYPNNFDEDVYDYYVFVPWDDSKDYRSGVDVFINAEFDKMTLLLNAAASQWKMMILLTLVL